MDITVQYYLKKVRYVLRHNPGAKYGTRNEATQTHAFSPSMRCASRTLPGSPRLADANTRIVLINMICHSSTWHA